MMDDLGTRTERLTAMEGSHFWTTGRDHLIDLLIDRYHSGTPLVDAGSGTGAFAASLAERLDDEVLWFDVEPIAAPGFRASITAIPLPDGFAKTVLARDVLEHVADRTALRECLRILRPGGTIIATVPAWPALWSARDVVAGHLRRYTRSTLRDLFAASGFEVLEMRGYQFLLLPLVAVSRLLSRRDRIATVEREEQITGLLNRVLASVNRFEASLARHQAVRPPTGSSLVIVARKPR